MRYHSNGTMDAERNLLPVAEVNAKHLMAVTMSPWQPSYVFDLNKRQTARVNFSAIFCHPVMIDKSTTLTLISC